MAGKKRRTDPGPEEKKEEDTDISNPSQRRRFMGQQMGQQQQRQQEGEQLRSPRPEAWRSEMHRIAVDRLNDRTHRAAKALRARTVDSAHLLRAGLNKILNDYKFSLRAIDNEFILKPGFVAATGNGEQGELGIAEEEEMEKATKGHSALYKPQPVESLNGKGIIKVSRYMYSFYSAWRRSRRTTYRILPNRMSSWPCRYHSLPFHIFLIALLIFIIFNIDPLERSVQCCPRCVWSRLCLGLQ